MKTLKFFLLLIPLFFISDTVIAKEMTKYPVWGYNTQEHICQIKQISETSPSRENLSGNYWDIRECRSKNPEIIFYTGQGILIWFGLFMTIILFHHVIFPHLEKRTKAERVLYTIQDVVTIGIILFLIILLQHFFAIPRAFYEYTSDIDHIIYSTFIKARFPMYFAGAYLFISLVRTAFIYRKKLKKI